MKVDPADERDEGVVCTRDADQGWGTYAAMKCLQQRICMARCCSIAFTNRYAESVRKGVSQPHEAARSEATLLLIHPTVVKYCPPI